MIIRILLTCLVAAILFLPTGNTGSVSAAEEPSPASIDIAGTPEITLEESEFEEIPEGDAVSFRKSSEVHTLFEAFTGYRFLTVDGNGRRAAEYDYLHSGITGGAHLNYLGEDLKFDVDGAFTNDKDYHGDLHLDYAGDYRLHLRTEALFHNLDALSLFDNPFILGATYIPDPVSETNYGVKVNQDTAVFRFKLHEFPLHVNLGYWRLLKEGSSQLRFADSAFEGATNTIYTRSRPINRQVHEETIGFDSHLGPIDLIYNFQVRRFEDNAGILRDVTFAARPDLAGNPSWGAGAKEHNEDPESSYFAHTLKLHTSLAGGIVGAASYTYGKRENRSRLSDVSGADSAQTTLQNVAGDFSYTPCKEFSLGLKYRRQEVANVSPQTITSSFATPAASLQVRPSPDTQKDILTATFSLRPTNLLTIKGEYKGEFLHRTLVNFGENSTLNWRDLPEDSDTHRGTVALISRPVKGLRLKAQYSYLTTNHPSYGTSFAEKHEGEFLASYNRTNRWGAIANFKGSRESNNQLSREMIQFPLSEPPAFLPYANTLSRDSAMNNLSTGFWFVPFGKMTVSVNFAFLRSSTDQGVLFTAVGNGNEAATNFTSQSEIYGLNATYQCTEKLDLIMALQQVRSSSEFDPTYVSFGTAGDTGGIKEISRLFTVDSTLSARANYRFSKLLNCSLDYSLRDYNDKHSSLYDGTVQSMTAFLSAKW